MHLEEQGSEVDVEEHTDCLGLSAQRPHAGGRVTTRIEGRKEEDEGRPFSVQ